MGYSTRYELNVIGESDPEIPHEVVIAKIVDYTYLFEDACKWYDHDKDMREYSKKYPDLVFELSGEGEEAGDLWVKYYKDGLLQVCNAQITFEPFDPLKLH